MNITAERAYPTPLANSPLLPMLLLSLATQRNAPKQSSTFKKEYDYIVVGGGSAGSVVASRLSEEPCVSVLLLEAGATKPPLLNDVPALSRFFWFTDIDWQYKTVPQKHAAYFLENQQVIWPSGKGLGGSSLLNAMLYVRGNKKDYDDWEAQGAKGWNYKNVLPYFLKLENNTNPDYLNNGYHATGGPITAENPKYQSEIRRPLYETAQELGYRILDSNAARQTGFNDLQGNIRNGQRCSTAKAYLVPAENRTNLDIIKGAHVKKILFDGSRAVGVQFDYRNKEYNVRTRQEVIMSAGTVNTAQILMLSGIGPKEHLKKLKIPVIANLPVGNNLQDHCCCPLPFTFDSKTIDEKLQDPQNINAYVNNRTGPLSSVEFISVIAFLNGKGVSPREDFPDYQLYFIEINKQIAKYQTGLKPLLYDLAFSPYENDPIFICLSSILHPKSRGTVRLQSTNPYDPPLIDPNYYADPADVEAVVKGLKTCLKIGSSKSMKKVGAKRFETFLPKLTDLIPDLLRDEYLKVLAKSFVLTLNHQVGTAKMGDPKDPTTVVDPELRVKGIQGLRVVDASVMPIVPSGNTNIPTIMVAEKASDIIKDSISCRAGDNS
ncbi:glucose dehydrogenase [FAD, quinone]-like [Argiope bruennichi]|uniref:glucose dehydrogenase [FAD, quinone]-like n=1 Tax=Argiope bruennichi TaxID=94029 RepID=UPI002493E97F|nr:glucose dehydrogenase [FAD, quinone]-like [Argiope bruennichi]